MSAQSVLHLQILPYKLKGGISAKFREAPDLEVCFVHQAGKMTQDYTGLPTTLSHENMCWVMRMKLKQQARGGNNFQSYGKTLNDDIYMFKSALTIPISSIRIVVLKKRFLCF